MLLLHLFSLSHIAASAFVFSFPYLHLLYFCVHALLTVLAGCFHTLFAAGAAVHGHDRHDVRQPRGHQQGDAAGEDAVGACCGRQPRFRAMSHAAELQTGQGRLGGPPGEDIGPCS